MSGFCMDKVKNAVLTGASKGIGKKILEKLALEKINVWCLCRTWSEEFSEYIEKLEKEMTDLKLSLEEKDSRVLLLEEGTVIIQRSLLALMSHAINGNDIAKLQSAKNDLEEYLTARR